MSQAPFDDLPQPYGPGWWETWPGEVSPGAPASVAGAPAPVGPVDSPQAPPARRFIRTLGEYMQAVRAAVPYLGNPAGADVEVPHDSAARTLIGRVSRSAADFVAAPTPTPPSAEADLDELSRPDPALRRQLHPH